jgi:hypothetical protein
VFGIKKEVRRYRERKKWPFKRLFSGQIERTNRSSFNGQSGGRSEVEGGLGEAN